MGDSVMTISDIRAYVNDYRIVTEPFEYKGLPKEILDRVNPDDKFELLENRENGKFVFIPLSKQLLLFRGQREEIVPCYPSLLRNAPDKIRIFAEKVRLVEFEHLLLSHPLVKEIFIPNRWIVDFEGLAQHYGLKTSVLDFTASLDVALFFAMTKYDGLKDVYTPSQCDGKAIIYVINPLTFDPQAMRNNRLQMYSHQLTPIGMQPFERPAAQRGFSLRVENPLLMNRARVFEFHYTKREAKEYFERFDKARQLWVRDELISKTKLIKNKTLFNTVMLEEAWNRFPVDGTTLSEVKRILGLRGIRFSEKAMISQFSPNECVKLRDRLQARINRLLRHVVQRKYIELEEDARSMGPNGEITAKVKDMRDHLSLDTISSMALLNLISHGRSYPEGTRPAKQYVPG